MTVKTSDSMPAIAQLDPVPMDIETIPSRTSSLWLGARLGIIVATLYTTIVLTLPFILRPPLPAGSLSSSDTSGVAAGMILSVAVACIIGVMPSGIIGLLTAFPIDLFIRRTYQRRAPWLSVIAGLLIPIIVSSLLYLLVYPKEAPQNAPDRNLLIVMAEMVWHPQSIAKTLYIVTGGFAGLIIHNRFEKYLLSRESVKVNS